MGRNEYTYTTGYRGTLSERMTNKTIKTDIDNCWIWSGSCDTAGYACIRVNGKLCRASHVAFQMHTSMQVPCGMIIMHSCDNPACVNPYHLSLGTKLLNNLDKAKKGRCRARKGEAHPMAKLKQKDVDEIREIFSKGEHTFTALASMFNINRATVANVVKRITWV